MFLLYRYYETRYITWDIAYEIYLLATFSNSDWDFVAFVVHLR